jgi:hypothetical protein
MARRTQGNPGRTRLAWWGMVTSGGWVGCGCEARKSGRVKAEGEEVIEYENDGEESEESEDGEDEG